jgi:predicted Zn-dependent protease
MRKANLGNLELQIEELVGEHVAALRRTATSAVERAFARMAGGKARSEQQRASSTVRVAGQRRAPEELTALSDRLYAVICAHPGATMVTLAAEMGATARELNRPARQLRRTGRVRSAGQRQATRYFPMSGKPGTRS